MPYRGMGYDPVGAGIQAFTSLTSLFDRQAMQEEEKKNLSMRRQMMLSDIENEKQRREKTKKDMEWQDKVRTHTEKEWGRQDQVDFDSKLATRLVGISGKLDKGMDLDDSEITDFFAASLGTQLYRGLGADKVSEVNSSMKNLRQQIQQYQPQILQAVKGNGGYLDRANAPDLFNALDKIPIYGGRANTGATRDGRTVESDGAKKFIDKIYIDPKDQTIVPVLRVESPEPNGEVYYAPMTVGRDAATEAQVLKVPIGLFDAHLRENGKLSDQIDILRMKLGDKEFTKKWAEGQERLKRSRVYASGPRAVLDLIATNPKATTTEIRATFIDAVRKKSEELGLSIDEKELNAEAKDFVEHKEEKKSPGILEYEEYSKLTPDQKKEYDDLQSKKAGWKETPFQRTMAKTAEGRLEETKRHNKALEAEKATEAKEKKAERVEKEKEKALSVTEQRQLNKEAFNRYSSLLPDDLEDREAIIKRGDPGELVKSLPDEQQSQVRDIIDRATEIKKDDKKLTWTQSLNKAESEIGKPKKALKPMTPEIHDKIVKEVKKKNPKNKAEAVEMATKMARDLGYNPE